MGRWKLRLRYIKPWDFEIATIETEDGYYLCEVHQTSDEGKRKFRQRAQALRRSLEMHPHPLVTLSPKCC